MLRLLGGASFIRVVIIAHVALDGVHGAMTEWSCSNGEWEGGRHRGAIGGQKCLGRRHEQRERGSGRTGRPRLVDGEERLRSKRKTPELGKRSRRVQKKELLVTN